MTLARTRTLFIVLLGLITLALVIGLVLYALRQNISLFYTPTQIAEGQAPLHHSIRLGGMVEKGSFIRARKGLHGVFKVTDFNQAVKVSYKGILPDLFREGQGVVVEGYLFDNQNFQASRVLAKHDANYMPPEVKAALGKKVKP
jgi:cytochrome c-type biogenesis protein CcmE